MKCKKLRRVYPKYIDGQLPQRESRSVEEHVSNCQDCAAEVNSLENLRSLLHTSAQVKVSDKYWDTYWTRLEKKLPDEPSPVTFASRISDALARVFQKPAVFGRVAIYALFLALALYITMSDRLIKTPPTGIPVTTMSKNMKAKTPALPAEEAVVEEEIAQKKVPYADSAPVKLMVKDMDDFAEHEADREDIAAKSEEPAKPEIATEAVLDAAQVGEIALKTKVESLESVQDEYALAENYFKQGEYQLAIPAYQNFVAANATANVQDRRTLQAVYQIGEAYYQMGNYSDALSNFVAVTDKSGRPEKDKSAALTLSAPEPAPASRARRKVMARAMRQPESQRGAEKKRERKRDNIVPNTLEGLISRAIFRQAESYEHLGKQEEALAAYKKYAEKYPRGEYISQAREKMIQQTRTEAADKSKSK